MTSKGSVTFQQGVRENMNEAAELISQQVWDDFTEIVQDRLSRFQQTQYDYTLSEENFRLDFAVVLARRWNYASKIFAEYPCDLAPKQKLDLFVDEDPGLCFEFKFYRPIPSEYNLPLTQHLGSFWADVLKLKHLCRHERSRFLTVFMDHRVRSYFAGKEGFPMTEGESQKTTLDLRALPKTAVQTVEKRLPRIDVPVRTNLTITSLRVMTGEPFNGYLLGIA